MVRQQKTLDCQQKESSFKRKYQESFLNYVFITTGNSHSPSLPFIILSNEAMKP